MKIKTDCFYRTRGGKKAYVYYSGDGFYLAVIANLDGFSYCKDGKCLSDERDFDLVKEWEGIELEADKFYETRSGCKVYVYAPVDAHKGEYLAVMPSHELQTRELVYNSNGINLSKQRGMDIVAEWEDSDED